MGRLALSWDTQPQEWLAAKQGPLAQIVAHWILEDLLDEDVEIRSVLLIAESGQRRNVSRVPGTKVDVTWLEAAPFRTIRVVWIEEDSEHTQVS